MNLEINIVEAAAELAEREIKDFYKTRIARKGASEEELDLLMYDLGEDDVLTYTKDAQEIFNVCYDEIFDVLLNCKTQKEDD
jgi:hypothetical protein